MSSLVEIVLGVLFFLAFVVGTVRSLPAQKSLLEQEDYVAAGDLQRVAKD